MARKLLISVFSALALLMGLLLVPLEATAAPSTLTITQQPEDVEVTYPGGATFHVEVSDPDQVASYQWIISDGYSDFVLKGTSATTDTLVMPSTQQDDPDLLARCVITDKDGNTVESEPGVMHVANPDQNKTVLYVGDYAVEPGQTLDLSQTSLGSGTVIFDSDGATITLDNVRISTEAMTYDAQLSPSLGLFLIRRDSEIREYHVNLVGDSVIYDTFYDPDYNSAGVVFNMFFRSGDDENPPTVFIEGEGSLELKGGSNSIYSDANVTISAALTTEPNGDIFCDALTCRNLTITDGAKLNIDANGTALKAKDDLCIERGAAVDLHSSAPHVSVGATAKSIVSVNGSIAISGATLSIRGNANPERFVPYESLLANFTGISYGGDLAITGSTVSIEMASADADEDWHMSCYGISGEGETSSATLTGASKLMVIIDTPKVPFVGGIIVPGVLGMDKDCAIDVTVTSAGETLGIEADHEITISDATLDSVVTSTDGATTYGVVCGGITVNLTEASYHLRSLANGGVALAADTGEHGEFDIEPERGYTPQKIVIPEGVGIVAPEKGEVNLFGAPGYGETIKAETVYDAADMATPASEVVISVSDASSGPSNGVLVGLCAVVGIAAVAFFILRRTKGTAEAE